MTSSQSAGATESRKGTPRTYSLGNVATAFVTSLALLRHFKVIVPLLIYLALKLLVIAWYLESTVDPWSSFWAIFIRGIGGAKLAHYPLHLVMMQKILGRFDIVMYIFIQIVFLGATALLVSAAYKRTAVSLKIGFSAALGSYLNLIVVAFISSALLLAAVNAPGLVEKASDGFPISAMAALASLLGLLVQSLFVYAIPSVMLGNRSAIRATGESFSITRHSFMRSFAIVVVPFILISPIMLLELKANAIAIRISPDFLIYLQVASEVLHVVAAYLLTACATIVYIWRNG